MITFALGAAALLLLAAGFVAWPLYGRARAGVAADARRAQNLALWRAERAELDRQLQAGVLDAAEHARARDELDRRALEETEGVAAGVLDAAGGRRALLAVAVAVPLLALVLYALLGAQGELKLNEELAQLERSEDQGERNARLVVLLPRLEAAARRRDSEGQYRYLLARSYMSLGRHAEAAAFFGELARIFPEDAGLLAQQAQALYLAGGRAFTPAIQALVDRAFVIDPAQVTLLGMVGMDRFQAGDYAGAVAAWEKLLAQLPAGAPDAAVIRDGIAMARARAGGEQPEALPGHAAASGTEQAANTAAPRLRVAVSVDKGLDVPANGTVFVFARALSGPPMPLAVARFAASELPRVVLLDDSQAMAPGMSLSSFEEVTVVARITQSGQATPAPGDVEGGGAPLRLRPGEQSVDVRIDRVL